MHKFKIENFCEEHNLEFKQYYTYLNNPLYLSIFINYMGYIDHELIQKKILSMIPKNHSYILDRIKKTDTLVKYYIQNNLINSSELGKFFKYYLKCRKNIDINNHKQLFKLFYKLVHYPELINALKEAFYIFSDYRACIYYMTPSINFYNTKKSVIENVVIHFRDNINTLNQIISKVYLGDQNNWGSIYYSSAYSMFETLMILKKYFKDPLKMLNITFLINKKCKKNDLTKDLYNNYQKLKLKDSTLTKKNINSISQFIVFLKKEGYDLWFTIPLIFNTIYKSYELDGLPDSLLVNHKKIYYQKMNNIIGLMCYILVEEGFITNVNIYQKFND